MTPAELAAACAASLDRAKARGEPESKARMMLTMSAGWKRPKGFPRGEVACVTPNGSTVGFYSTAKVGRWLLGHLQAARAPKADRE